MRITISWGNTNRLRMEAVDDELPAAAAFVVERCEMRKEDLVTIEVEDNRLVRKLFDDHLCNMKFGLVESRECEGGPVIKLHLMYKKAGWTLGVKTENGTADG